VAEGQSQAGEDKDQVEAGQNEGKLFPHPIWPPSLWRFLLMTRFWLDGTRVLLFLINGHVAGKSTSRETSARSLQRITVNQKQQHSCTV
jgi:hypothetical protein